jgi:hypothetical protein
VKSFLGRLTATRHRTLHYVLKRKIFLEIQPVDGRSMKYSFVLFIGNVKKHELVVLTDYQIIWSKPIMLRTVSYVTIKSWSLWIIKSNLSMLKICKLLLVNGTFKVKHEAGLYSNTRSSCLRVIMCERILSNMTLGMNCSNYTWFHWYMTFPRWCYGFW